MKAFLVIITCSILTACGGMGMRTAGDGGMNQGRAGVDQQNLSVATDPLSGLQAESATITYR